MSDTGPLFVSSGDLIADRRYKWAIDQAARGDFVAAADILAQTVEVAPTFATAWFALGAMLDLGCGTGLAGTAFAPLADRLVGVDLSPAMVAQAENKQLYDRVATG